MKTLDKIVICILCLLMSCSGEDPVEPNIPGNPPSSPPPSNNPAPSGNQNCLLTRFTSNQISYEVTRNDVGLPIQVKFTETDEKLIDFLWNFEYDDSNRLVKSGYGAIFFTYQYDELNRLVSEKYEAPPNSLASYLYGKERFFTYNDAGYLDSAYYSAQVYERFVYDDEGNLTKKFVKYFDQPEFLMNEYLDFSNKKNPFYEFSFLPNLLMDLEGIETIIMVFVPTRNKYLPNQSKTYKADGTSTSYNGVLYTYNDSNYPVAIGGDFNITYDYRCE